VVILKAAAGEQIPLYGDVANVHDWHYGEDHVEAKLLAATSGDVGLSYCVGGQGERANQQVEEAISQHLDGICPEKATNSPPVSPMVDAPSHDRQTTMNLTGIGGELDSQACHSLEDRLAATVRCHSRRAAWRYHLRENAGCPGQRFGTSRKRNASITPFQITSRNNHELTVKTGYTLIK